MKRFLSLGLICGVLLWSGSAWALSVASTTSTLSWDTLSFQVHNLEITSEALESQDYRYLGDKFTHVRAEAREDSVASIGTADRYWENEWYEHEQIASVGNSQGISRTTPNELLVYATGRADGLTAINAGAASDLHRTTDIYIPYDVRLSISIEYVIQQEILSDLAAEDADIFSLIALTLSRTVYSEDAQGQIIPSVVESYSDSANEDGDGLLNIVADLTGGCTYSLNAHMYSSVNAYSPAQTAPVPEPSTMVLMGLGLMGLAGMGRKRLKN